MGFVPGTGFEPAHLAAPPPEDGASTNFATRAVISKKECKYNSTPLSQCKFFRFKAQKQYTDYNESRADNLPGKNGLT